MENANLCDKFYETFIVEIYDTSGEVEVETRFTLIDGQRMVYGENKLGGGIKNSVRIYVRGENYGNYGRWVVAKINIWMQKGKHDMLSTQLRKMQKKRSLVC